MGSQKEIGKNIKKARLKAGLTQAKAAKKAGIHTNYFARIERGEENPTSEVLEAIIKALGVTSSDILPY